MYAQRHRRLISRVLVASGLLLLAVSGSGARQPGGVWRMVDSGSNGPEVRKHSTVVYDPTMKRIIMFGGDKESGGAWGDVWAYQLPCGPWTELFNDQDATDCSSNAERPCQRHGHAATVLPGSPPKMLIHGGKLANNCVANDTWELTLDGDLTWTRLWEGPANADGNPDPYSRWHSAVVTLGGQAYFYAGATLGSACSAGYGFAMCDTWKFAQGAQGWDWNYVSGERTPPMQGGTQGPCVPSGTIPQSRYQHSLIVDEKNSRMVTFGGVYDGGVGTSNAWAYSISSGWARLGPFNGDVPPPDANHPEGYNRALHTATYDPIGERMIVIGGYSESELDQVDPASIVSVVTAMDAPNPVTSGYGTWSTLEPDGSGPGKIAEHAAVYDPEGDRILVFGGVDEHGDFRNELWALEFDPINVGSLSVSFPPSVEIVGQTGGVIDPNGVVCVHVENNGLPQSGVQVGLDFSQLEETNFALSQPEMQITCSPKRLSSTTDASGNATIHVLGGADLSSGCPSSSNPEHTGFGLYVNGTFTGKYVPYRSYDVNGDQAVDSNDFSLWLALAGGSYCSVIDYDGDGSMDADDQSLWLGRFFAATSVDLGGSSCSGGQGSSLKPAPPQLEAVPVITGITGVRPSPASGTVAVDIELAQAVSRIPLNLRVYDVLGRLVRTLPSQGLGPGRHSVRWDTNDESGQRVKSGIYVVRMDAGATVVKRQVVVVR